MNDKTQETQVEYESMRARLEHLRIQANLGKMEARAKLDELGRAMEPAYRRAKSTLSELAKSGAQESVRLAKSMQAGWEELMETHRELVRKSKEQAPHDSKRS